MLGSVWPKCCCQWQVGKHSSVDSSQVNPDVIVLDAICCYPLNYYHLIVLILDCILEVDPS